MADLGDRLQRALGARYRVLEELGSGAAGVVFLADDLKLGRKVALKVLRPEIGQSLGGERFLREIRISARLGHPNILPLIDSGTADGLLYYVMFYVRGETLRDRLERESQLGIQEAVGIARQVAEALDHAHQHGVVHRDVKPENILLEDGRPLVCDFGVARAIGEAGDERLTRAGFAVGTPAYMSPEQGTGEREVDHRADIYALGCVLYEMLMGAPPFAGGPAHVILARRSIEDAPGMRGVRATIPPDVERATLKALARTPADRFESAGDFARALEEARADSGAVPEGRWRRIRRASGRIALLGVTAVVGGVALMLMGRSEAPGPLRLRATPATSLPGLEGSPSFAPDGGSFVFSGVDGGDEDIFLRLVDGERNFNLTEDFPADDHSPAFSPDGERIAFRSSRDGGGIFVMGRDGGAPRRVSAEGESPTWSPDGRSLSYVMEYVDVSPLNLEAERPGLWTVDLETGERRELVSADAVLPSWSPDGRWIAYTGRSDGSYIWMVPASGGDPVRLTDGGGNDWGPAWSPDSEYLYFSSDRGGSMNLWRMGVDTDRGRALGAPEPLSTPSTFAAHPSVSPDGRRVLYASVLTTQQVELATLAPGADTLVAPVAITTGTRQWSSPDISPDGSRVAFYSRDLPEGDLYLVNRDGTGLRQLTGDSAIDRVPRWSPDGSRIAYFSNRSGELQAWVIGADGSGNERVSFTDGMSVPGGWAPDGARMALNSPDRGLSLDMGRTWGDDTPEPLPSDSTSSRFVSNDWSRDGTRLAMFRYGDRGVGVYHLATGRTVSLTDFGEWPVWMPDSRRILFVTGGDTFWLVDTESGDTHRVHESRRDVIGPPNVAADGRTIVYSRRVTEGDIWLLTIEEGGS